MAAEKDILAGYIVDEIVQEYNLGSSNESLEKYADAIARAVTKFLTSDVQVSVGQQILGQGVGVVAGPGGGTVNTEVTGKVTTKGKLI